MFRCAGQDDCKAGIGDFSLLTVVASAEVTEFLMGKAPSVSNISMLPLSAMASANEVALEFAGILNRPMGGLTGLVAVALSFLGRLRYCSRSCLYLCCANSHASRFSMWMGLTSR